MRYIETPFLPDPSQSVPGFKVYQLISKPHIVHYTPLTVLPTTAYALTIDHPRPGVPSLSLQTSLIPRRIILTSLRVQSVRPFTTQHQHMPPKDQPSRRSSTSGSSRSEGQSQRPPTTRQLITFVDSQDPNSRSAIQRHTAHHSNAQRRNARLQSLRSTRPRLLEWQRRPNAEPDSLAVTSPHSSTSSTSQSPVLGLHTTLSAPGSLSTELANASISSPERMTPPSQSGAPGGPVIEVPVLDDGMVETCKSSHLL